MYIGIDVGGTKLAAGVMNDENRLLSRVQRKTRADVPSEELCLDIAALAREAAARAGVGEDKILSVGMGFPGSVDDAGGRVLYTPNLPFRDTPVRELFQRQWDIPVRLGNDATCAFLGEYFAGAAKGARSAVAVTLGTGVGMGVAVEGQVLGLHGSGTEGGHMVIAADGEQCSCGRRGCWEQYSSASALVRMTRAEMHRSPSSAMWRLCREDEALVNGCTAFDAARLGDAAGKSVVSQYLHYLAIGLANLVNLFQPEILCLGGGVSNEGDDLFLDPLKKLVFEQCYNAGEAPRTVLTKCLLGNAAGIVGAALLGHLPE